MFSSARLTRNNAESNDLFVYFPFNTIFAKFQNIQNTYFDELCIKMFVNSNKTNEIKL